MVLLGKRPHSHSWFVLFLLLLGQQYRDCLGSDSIDGRYSFSLTTFDPSGKLGQVERASVAASLGTPILAVVKGQRILLASPQILPSPLMQDDGTARFAPVAPHICVGHSGISADGRVLVAAAQRLAVEHAYTFDEGIPIELFLEELSLLFQEYTMKPASRPFGATLLVAHIPPADSESTTPQLFRIDPSGAVVALDKNYAVINGKFSSDLDSKLKELASSLSEEEGCDSSTIEQDRQSLSQILQEVIAEKFSKDKKNEKVSLPSTIISASLTKEAGLEIERRKLTSTTSTP
jgi:20S proteasome alpha/beta subunit